MHWGRVVCLIYLCLLLVWAAVYIGSSVSYVSYMLSQNQAGDPNAGSIAGMSDNIAIGLLVMILAAHPVSCLLGNAATNENENGKIVASRNVLIVHRLQLMIVSGFFIGDLAGGIVSALKVPDALVANFIVAQIVFDLCMACLSIVTIFGFRAASSRPPVPGVSLVLAKVGFAFSIVILALGYFPLMIITAIGYAETDTPLLLQQGAEWFAVSVLFVSFSCYLWNRQASGVFSVGHFVISLLCMSIAFVLLLSEVVPALIAQTGLSQETASNLAIIRILASCAGIAQMVVCVLSIILLVRMFMTRIKPSGLPSFDGVRKEPETEALLHSSQSATQSNDYVPPMRPPMYQNLNAAEPMPLQPNNAPPAFAYQNASSRFGDFEYDKRSE